MSRLSPLNKWRLQLLRKFQKWTNFEAEWDEYMPDQSSYRFPSPSSTERAVIPKQEFMRNYKLKYYEQDSRDFQNSTKNFHVLFRDEIISAPMRLKPGQTNGPFRLGGNKEVTYYHESEDKQVYTYEKSVFPHAPEGFVDPLIQLKQRVQEQSYIPPKENLSLNK